MVTKRNLPGNWDILHAFFDADDDSDFDDDAGANYITGCIQGIADALDMSVPDLLAAEGLLSDEILLPYTTEE